MARNPGFNGPLKMGVYVQPGPISGAQAALLALHPNLNEAHVIGAYIDGSSDNIQFRITGFAHPLFWLQGTAGLTKWIEPPYSTTEIVSLNRDNKFFLQLNAVNIADGSHVGILYSYGPDSLTDFRDYPQIHTHTFTTSSTNANLATVLGEDAYICGVTLGSGTGDAIQLKSSSLFPFWDSDASIGASLESAFLPYPIPTRIVQFLLFQYDRPDVLADVTVGSGGSVTLFYFKA